MKIKAIILGPKDNVATAFTDLDAGEIVEMEINNSTISVTLVEPVNLGHKFSLTHIKSNSPILKYGETIGVATKDIQPGQHVHVHNIKSVRAYGNLSKEVKK